MATPAQVALYARAAKGELSVQDAIKQADALKAPAQEAAPAAPKTAARRVAPKPLDPALAHAPGAKDTSYDTRLGDAPPPPPPKPHVGVPPVFESGDLGETTYAGAAKQLAKDSPLGRTVANTAAIPAASGASYFNAADAARAKVMAALRRAKDATPSPDELLEAGKSVLGGG